MNRHRIDLFSLLAGLLFVGFATAYIVGTYTSLHINARLTMPLLLVWLGVAGLLSAIVAQRRNDQRLASDTATDPVPVTDSDPTATAA